MEAVKDQLITYVKDKFYAEYLEALKGKNDPLTQFRVRAYPLAEPGLRPGLAFESGALQAVRALGGLRPGAAALRVHRAPPEGRRPHTLPHSGRGSEPRV